MTENKSLAKEKTGSSAMPKIAIVVVLVLAVGATLYLKAPPGPPAVPEVQAVKPGAASETASPPAVESASAVRLPRLVDVGAAKCIPCKMMAPILEELKAEYAGKFEVQFVDVWKNPDAGAKYGVKMIPTQIFYDASGQERFRHVGFFSKEDILAQWKELGVALAAPAAVESFSRWEPAVPDTRPKDRVCYLCDGDIDAKTRTVMKTPAGDVGFCSPHCYLITYASLTDEKKTHESASVTDWTSGALTPVLSATYLQGMDATGRPTVKAFSNEAMGKAEQQAAGGNLLSWSQFEEKETAIRCGFCDRPVYIEDACVVRVDGMQTWGCCVMCALGVAARTGKDIEVQAKDALTGDAIRVKTFEGHVAELAPNTAVAWAGARKDAEGKIVSTGCFKQAFFINEENLKKWVEAHPTATGHQVTIEQALAAKMKLTPEQISKACKIGECAPK